MDARIPEPSLSIYIPAFRYAAKGNLVLEEVRLRPLEPGSFTAIIGPNGAGKSTLLKIALGIVPAEGSKTFIAGEALPKFGRKRAKLFAYVPQRSDVDWGFPADVEAVVAMGRHIPFYRFGTPPADQKIIDQSLRDVEMYGFRKRPIGDLSGGQQQRVFLARALAQQAEVLILDEPMKGLDEAAQNDFFAILHKLRARGITILMVHHDLSDLWRFSDLVFINRRVIAQGPVEDVLTDENLTQTYDGKIRISAQDILDYAPKTEP